VEDQTPFAVVQILATRIVPNFSTSDPATARAVAGAVLAGGCPIFEFTNRTGAAIDAFRSLAAAAREELPDVLLGAGTITVPRAAEQFIAAGARFIVGPNFHPGVAGICAGAGVAYIPGCATPSEVVQAIEAGASLIKIFPAAQLGGPAFIKALLGPFPDARFMPSGGVRIDADSIDGWFGVGAACLSIGSDLFPAAAIAAGDWAAITANVASVMAVARR
jgi:2-dehydro-3-deoxyphosphogluconate aldolase/(4S)-4-hydroxy-2-oxoglutarate aldolase